MGEVYKVCNFITSKKLGTSKGFCINPSALQIANASLSFASAENKSIGGKLLVVFNSLQISVPNLPGK